MDPPDSIFILEVDKFLAVLHFGHPLKKILNNFNFALEGEPLAFDFADHLGVVGLLFSSEVGHHILVYSVVGLVEKTVLLADLSSVVFLFVLAGYVLRIQLPKHLLDVVVDLIGDKVLTPI